MSWRTVVISKRCKLDYSMGYMVIRGEETNRIFLDEEIELFVKTVKLRQMQVLLLESSSRQRIDGIKQLTVDCDLCEI